MFPDLAFDAARLSMFQWLVVEEEVALDPRPAARAIPWLFQMMVDHDLDKLNPTRAGSRPPLKTPCSLSFSPRGKRGHWSEGQTGEGSAPPWVYSVVEDIFVRPKPPCSADTLAWRILSFDDGRGGTDELEVPEDLLSVKDAARHELAAYMDARWPEVKRALGSPLFETPVAHFFVRAFLSEGIDEFLAHLMTIEAALGLHADYNRKFKPLPKATERVAARIVALLGDPSAFGLYKDLFEVRSFYLHGRTMGKAISTKERTDARKSARRVTEAFVKQANRITASTSREAFLNSLLDRGALVVQSRRP